MQLAALVVGVVHAADAGEQLEAERLVVPQQLGHRGEVLAADEERDLAAVHDDLLDGGLDSGGPARLGQCGGHVVHPSAVRRGGVPGHLDRTGEAAVPGGVAGAPDAEHALASADLLAAGAGCVRDVLRHPVRGVEVGALTLFLDRVLAVALLGHQLIRPFIWPVGSAFRPVSSLRLDLGEAVGAELGRLHLVVQLEDGVDQHLGSGRTAGEVHVDRHHVVDALDDRVVVEHAAGAGADAHREHPLGLGHLVVDLAQHGGHLLADPAGHDHQVGLAGAGPEDLHAEAGEVVLRSTARHHLDRAAGQAERRRPEGRLAHVAGDAFDGGEEYAARQLLFDTHVNLLASVIAG